MSGRFLESSNRLSGEVYSLLNSSNVPLTSGQVFTGASPADEVFYFSSVSVNCYYEGDTTATLKVRQSYDGSNFDNIQEYPLKASTSFHRVVLIVDRYCNIQVENTGANDMTAFRLSTIYSKGKLPADSKIPNNSLVCENENVQLVRNMTDLNLDLALGRYHERSIVKVHGLAPEVKDDKTVIIRDEADADNTSTGLSRFLTSAEAVRVKVGGSANDKGDVAPLGSHARVITIKGLNENWQHVTEDITLKGIAVSDPTTTTFIRVFSAHVKESGSYGVGAFADINIETVTSNTQMLRIKAGRSKTNAATYTTASDENAYLRSASAGNPNDKMVIYDLMKREDSDVIAAPFKPAVMCFELSSQGFNVKHEDNYQCKFPPKCDIWINAISTFGNVKSCLTNFELLIVKNSANC